MPPSAIRLQPRDLALLAELREVGLLDTTTLHDRHFPADRTGKACLRRLALYARHGLVEPIAPSVSFGLPRGGRLPAIHRLTPRGVEVLTSLTGENGRRAAGGSPKPETLLHRLGCAQLQLLLRDACSHARLPPPVWIGEYDMHPGASIRSPLSDRFVLCHTYTLPNGRYTCWPDAAALVLIPGLGGSAGVPHPLVMLFEYDRSTETLKQVAGKVPGYEQLLARGDWRTYWPDLVKPTVRVFVLTRSEDRIRTIVAAIHALPGADHFRFAVFQRLKPESFFTDAVWQTCRGDSRTILKPTTDAA
jgi:hypothetical protein